MDYAEMLAMQGGQPVQASPQNDPRMAQIPPMGGNPGAPVAPAVAPIPAAVAPSAPPPGGAIPPPMQPPAPEVTDTQKLTAAAVPAAQAASPEEKKNVVQDTGDFFTKMRTDPAMSQAMLMMGTRLMQGPKAGQDAAGMFGDAMMVGATAHNMIKEQERITARQKEQDAQKKLESDTHIAGMKADTEGKLQKTQQDAELFPQTKAKLELDLANAKTDGERKRAEAFIKAFEANPENLAKKFKLDQDIGRANINQSNAAAGASGAAARASNANTGNIEARTTGQLLENDAMAIIADPKSTPAQIKAAKLTMRKGQEDPTTGTSATLVNLIKQANPTWTEEQVAQKALDMTGTSKTNDIQAALKIKENSDAFDKATNTAADAVIAQYMQGKAGGATPAPAAPTKGGKSGAASASSAPAGPIQIKDAAGFNALPSGTVFLDPNGVKRTKP